MHAWQRRAARVIRGGAALGSFGRAAAPVDSGAVLDEQFHHFEVLLYRGEMKWHLAEVGLAEVGRIERHHLGAVRVLRALRREPRHEDLRDTLVVGRREQELPRRGGGQSVDGGSSGGAEVVAQ